LKDHDSGRAGWVVLLRDVNPIIALRIRKDPAGVLKLCNIPLGDTRLAVRVGIVLIDCYYCHLFSPSERGKALLGA